MRANRTTIMHGRWLLLVQYSLVWNTAMASSYAVQLLYPRPALYDMQLTSSFQVLVEFNGLSQDVRTIFIFHPHGQCVKGDTYNYTVLVRQEGARQPCHIEGPFQLSSCEGRMDVTAYGLHRSQHYTATVVAYSDRVSLKSKKVDIYTSAVQKVEVVKGEGCMSVTCYFATGSSAMGCVVQMRIINSHTSQHLHLWSFNVSQDPHLLLGTLHVPLEPKTSAVEVEVYDLTATGRVGLLSIPPHISLSTDTKCVLGYEQTPFRAKAKMVVLFYISATFFIIGLLIVFVGMLCKVGKLHRHFRNKSYEVLEGSGTTQQQSSESLASSRRHTQLRPIHISSSPAPRGKTYGSYDVLNSPPIEWSPEGGGEKTESGPGSSGAALVTLNLHDDEGIRFNQQRQTSH